MKNKMTTHQLIQGPRWVCLVGAHDEPRIERRTGRVPQEGRHPHMQRVRVCCIPQVAVEGIGPQQLAIGAIRQEASETPHAGRAFGVAVRVASDIKRYVRCHH